MRMFQDLKTRNKVGVGIAAPLLLTVVIGVVALVSINGITDKAKLVDHTRKVVAEAAKVVGAAVNMETGMRGYLLAGREEFLQPYKDGELDVYRRIATLQETVEDNPGQVERLGEAKQILRDWQADVTEPTIALRREIGDAKSMDDVAALMGGARGMAIFNTLQGQIDLLISREQDLLTERRNRLDQQLAIGSVNATATRDAMKSISDSYAVIIEAKNLLSTAIGIETEMRGYLLTGEPEYLAPLNAGSEVFLMMLGELQQTLSGSPQQVEVLGEVAVNFREWIDTTVTPTIALRTEVGNSKTMDDMAALIGEARGKIYFNEFRGIMAAFIAEEEAVMELRQASTINQKTFAFWSILGGTLAAMVIGVIVATFIGASIANPIRSVTASMRRLSEGETDVDVLGSERKDEVGDMARATQVFKENALRIRELAKTEKTDQAARAKRQEAMSTLQSSIADVVSHAAKGEFSQRIGSDFEDQKLRGLAEDVNGLLDLIETGVKETGRVLEKVADGDLQDRMTGEFYGEFAKLQQNVNNTVQRLSDLVGRIADTTGTVRNEASEITSVAEEVSARAEQQASSLQETAATLEQVSSSIKANSDSSANAKTLAGNASQGAAAGGEIVKKAVSAMNEIEAGAEKISDIISVIDGIAFQTNLLALNAAVEAARAGDAGKGFAVVASEVRALAQRSSDASLDIRQLIEASAGQVSEGVKLVTETGTALENVVSSIGQVEEAIKEIAGASAEQATSIIEISSAVNHMDEITQRNSTMADQSASSARGLSGSAHTLQELISFFKTEGAKDSGSRGESAAA